MSKLIKVFTHVLGVEESKVKDDMSPKNTESWDSLNSIILLTEIEKAFNVKFNIDEAMAIKNFKEVKELVASKGKNPNE